VYYPLRAARTRLYCAGSGGEARIIDCKNSKIILKTEIRGYLKQFQEI